MDTRHLTLWQELLRRVTLDIFKLMLIKLQKKKKNGVQRIKLGIFCVILHFEIYYRRIKNYSKITKLLLLLVN